MPTVSICLPTYNGERFLAEAIESALAQTYADFELIITDDQSSDRSYEIAQSYAVRDSRVRVLRNEKNVGLFENYNESVRNAKGRLIKPFAQDDLWSAQIVQRCVEQFEEIDGLALVAVGRQWVNASGEEIPTQCEFDASVTLEGSEVITSCLLKLVNWIGEPSTVMFPREFAGSGFDPRYYHLGDLEYWFRILGNGRYRYLNEPLCRFRRHDASTTNKNLKGLKFALDMMLLGEQYSEYLSQSGITLDDFKTSAALNVATFWRHLCVAGEASLSELLEQTPKSSEEALEQLKQFKELAFYSLIAAAEREEESQVRISTLQSKLYRTEETLASLLTSRYWKSTSLFRRAAKIMKGERSVN